MASPGAVADRVTIELELKIAAYVAAVKAAQDAFNRSMDRTAEAAAAGERAVEQAANAEVKAINAAAAAAAKGAAQTGAATANLGFQFQDIAQGLLTGQSPFTIAVQQSFQLSAALKQAGGTTKALKAALTSIISPTTLITIGLVSAAGAAIGFFKNAFSGAADAEEITDRLTSTVSRLGDTYGLAAGAQKDLTEAERLDLLFRNTRDLVAETEVLGGALTDLKSELSGSLTSGRLAFFPSDDMRQLRDLVVSFQADLAAGTPDVAAFRTSIERLSESVGTSASASFTNSVDQILGWTEGVADSEHKVISLNNAITLLKNPLDELARQFFGLAGATDGFTQALDALDKVATPPLTEEQRAWQAYADAVAAAGDNLGLVAVARAHLEDALGRAKDLEDDRAGPDRIGDTVTALNQQAEAARLTGLELARYNALTEAGISANDAGASRVIAAADALYYQQQKTEKLDAATTALAATQKAATDAAADLAGSVFDAFASVAQGSEKASDAVRDLIVQLALAEAKAALLHLINPSAPLGPVGTLFAGRSAGASKIPHNAGGTDNWRGGPTWVGEKGPEIISLPRGAQVTPNNRAGGGNMRVEVRIANETGTPMRAEQRGQRVDGERMVIDVVAKAISDGKFDTPNRGRYGLVRPVNRRGSR